MGYSRKPHFVPGNALVACAECEMPFPFPDEISYCDDDKFRCKRMCLKSETVRGHNERRSAWSPPGEDDALHLPALKPGWR